jgi:hypothetical protein
MDWSLLGGLQTLAIGLNGPMGALDDEGVVFFVFCGHLLGF